MKALVVTTDRRTRQQLQEFFSTRRHAVETASDWAEAAELVGQDFYHFALLDLTSADKSALEVLRQLRQRHGDTTYVLVMPAAESPEALRPALEAGADDYLLKPINVGALQLRLAIGQRRVSSRQKIDLGERRYRTLLETMNEGLFQVNENGVIELANSSMSRITGYTRNQLVGESADELLVEPMVRDRLPGQTLLGSGTGSEEYSIPLKTRSGESVWVNLMAAPLPGADGGYSGSIGVLEDITEQRNAEEALRFREEYFRALLENANDLITIIDLDGRILYQSRSSERLLGLDAEEIVGRDFYELLHDDDRFKLEKTLEKTLAQAGATASVDLRVRHRAGHDLQIEALLNNLVDDPVVGGVVVNSRDVTERLRFEAAIQRERKLFQQLFSNSPAGIVILDHSDCVVDANRAFVDLFQFEVEELHGKPLSDFIVPEDLLLEARELSQLVFEQQNIARETLRLRKDGQRVDVSILGYPIGFTDTKIGAFGLYTDITERKNAERKLFHDAFHDGLTGLPNRTLFNERLERDLRRARRRTDYQFATLFIDLDGFKGVNDELGHAAGDEVLVQVARRLEGCLRPGDTTARLGGDEFTLILEDIKEPLDAVRVAERVLQALDRPFELTEQNAKLSASIGIAFSSTGYESVEELMRDADIAMYRAKTRGKACYEIFDSRMHSGEDERLALEGQLGAAIAEGQLRLLYQPIISASRGKLVGFEALVRWQHPERGILPPAVVLPIAEETGLIIPLGHWVIEEACRQLADWGERFGDLETLSVSLNLSRSELHHGELLPHFDRVLAASKVHPGQLTLEIPEDILLGISETLGETLWKLANRGMRLALDDFGRGDNSLRQVFRLPFERLKISRALVLEMTPGGENIELIRAACMVGLSLGLEVVAMAVESDEQRDHVNNLGAGLLQGFAIAAPMSPEEATELLADPEQTL